MSEDSSKSSEEKSEEDSDFEGEVCTVFVYGKFFVSDVKIGEGYLTVRGISIFEFEFQFCVKDSTKNSHKNFWSKKRTQDCWKINKSREMENLICVQLLKVETRRRSRAYKKRTASFRNDEFWNSSSEDDGEEDEADGRDQGQVSIHNFKVLIKII